MPDPAAQRSSGSNAGTHGLAAESEPEGPITPLMSRPSGRSIQVLATPIISVAVTPRSAPPSSPKSPSASPSLSNPPYEVVKPAKSSPHGSPWPVVAAPVAATERPAGVVEGVTFVEPRPVPGTGAELDSVILGPGVQAQPLGVPHQVEQRHVEQRRAPTIRTRLPLRPAPVAPTSSPREPSRRSSTLLAGVVAVALVLMGVSALLRTETSFESPTEGVEGKAAHARVDVQAAVPQSPARVAQQENAHAEDNAQAENNPQAENAAQGENAAQAEALAPAETPAQADVELLSSPTRDAAPRARVDGASRPPIAARTARAVAATPRSAPQRAMESVAPRAPAAAEGKSWIKVRE